MRWLLMVSCVVSACSSNSSNPSDAGEQIDALTDALALPACADGYEIGAPAAFDEVVWGRREGSRSNLHLAWAGTRFLATWTENESHKTFMQYIGTNGAVVSTNDQEIPTPLVYKTACVASGDCLVAYGGTMWRISAAGVVDTTPIDLGGYSVVEIGTYGSTFMVLRHDNSTGANSVNRFGTTGGAIDGTWRALAIDYNAPDVRSVCDSTGCTIVRFDTTSTYKIRIPDTGSVSSESAGPIAIGNPGNLSVACAGAQCLWGSANTGVFTNTVGTVQGSPVSIPAPSASSQTTWSIVGATSSDYVVTTEQGPGNPTGGMRIASNGTITQLSVPYPTTGLATACETTVCLPAAFPLGADAEWGRIVGTTVDPLHYVPGANTQATVVAAASPTVQLVAWIDNRNRPGGAGHRFFVARRALGGDWLDSVGTEVGVTTSATIYPPRVVWDGAHFVVMWEDGYTRFRRVAEDGTLVDSSDRSFPEMLSSQMLACTAHGCLLAYATANTSGATTRLQPLSVPDLAAGGAAKDIPIGDAPITMFQWGNELVLASTTNNTDLVLQRRHIDGSTDGPAITVPDAWRVVPVGNRIAVLGNSLHIIDASWNLQPQVPLATAPFAVASLESSLGIVNGVSTGGPITFSIDRYDLSGNAAGSVQLTAAAVDGATVANGPSGEALIAYSEFDPALHSNRLRVRRACGR